MEEIGTLRCSTSASQPAALASASAAAVRTIERAHPRLGIGVLLDQAVEHVVAGDVAELGPAYQHPPLQVDVVRGGLAQLVEVGQGAGARPGAQGGLRVAPLLHEPGRRLRHQLAERLALALR